MSESAIRELELNIKEAQKIVDIGAALERLSNNRDFKKVIIDGYFENEAVRLVHLKADPSMQKPETQASIILQMDAIGALNQFFQTIYHQSRLASKAVEDDEQTRLELMQEGLE